MAILTSAQFFESSVSAERSLIRASAPGRLDVMGGIADYSGSLLLQMPIRERTTVLLAPRTDRVLRVYSQAAAQAGLPALVQISLDALDNWSDYNAVRQMILRSPGGDWAVYVLGCFFVLMHEKALPAQGADVWVESEVPFGKGVSSSAALEVATMQAICRLYDLRLNQLELPLLAQRVENGVVGAPCGLMDQLACYLGRAGQLLPIVCQPVAVSAPVVIPEPVRLAGIDSGVKHAVSGSAYTRARVAAFMGYSLIAEVAGANRADLEQARQTNHWRELPYGGYLANLSVPEFEANYLPLLPERMTGSEFLARYASIIDPVTQVKPEETYAIRACTAHPVYENARVNRFADLLTQLAGSAANTDALLRELGSMLYAAHESYSRCGLGNPHTDELVAMVHEAGPDAAVYGAKITGGGSGGTVCVLGAGEAGVATARRIMDAYTRRHALRTYFFTGSSEGAYYS